MRVTTEQIKIFNADVLIVAECALHVTVLCEGLAEAGEWMPLSTDTPIGKEMLRVFDQIAYRFGKLQDSMGEKVMPLILDMAQETVPENATFAEKLNMLEQERYLLPKSGKNSGLSAMRWRTNTRMILNYERARSIVFWRAQQI